MTSTDYMYQERREEEDSVEDSADALMQRLQDYIEKHEGELSTATGNDTDNVIANIMIITMKQKWKEKQLYSRFERLINNISHEKTWT